MAHDVFISYSSKEKAIADAVCARLEHNRIRCWISPRDVLPGMDYGQAHVDAIRKTRVVVQILSSDSKVSRRLMREIERVVGSEFPVIPLQIKNNLPSGSMEDYLGSAHFENYVDKLALAIVKMLGGRIQLTKGAAAQANIVKQPRQKRPGRRKAALKDKALQPEEAALLEQARREAQEQEQRGAEIVRLQGEIETALASGDREKAKRLIPELNNLGPDGQVLAEQLQKRLPREKLPVWAWAVGGLYVAEIALSVVLGVGGIRAARGLPADTPVPVGHATVIPVSQPVQTDISIPVKATPTPTATATPSATPTQTPPAPTATSLPTAVLLINSNVRAGPGTIYPILMVYTAGTRLQIIGRSHAGDWLAFTLPGDAQGWIAASSLQVSFNIQSLAELKAPPTSVLLLEPSPTEAPLPRSPTLAPP